MTSILRNIPATFGSIYSGWILWNLFLALIPLLLSMWLFRRRSDARTWGWWVVLLVYVAFLPNAPYLLTDIIHLVRGIRNDIPMIYVVLLYIPLHVVSILLGFEAYVTALIYQGQYLRRLGARAVVPWSELLTHGVCALGIFLGRFRRYNSWDLVILPENVIIQTLDDLTSKRPFAAMVVIFLVLTILYWIMKQITLGLVLRFRYARSGRVVEI